MSEAEIPGRPADRRARSASPRAESEAGEGQEFPGQPTNGEREARAPERKAKRARDEGRARSASPRAESEAGEGRAVEGRIVYPKIELHVHLEGTVQPETLLAIAARNDYPLPTRSVEELRALYEFRDFAHFIEVWLLTTGALRREEDFRQIVVDYAKEAAGHGAVYLEAIFAPMLRRGVDCDTIFSGYCDGVQEARELHGVEIRLTPDIPRGYTDEEAETTVGYALKYRDRGVVGLGLGGLEAEYPPELYERAFALARSEGLASVPHAGETAGPASVRGALGALGAHRLRHGIRAVEDPDLVQELADRQIVLDVCPISNVRTKAVASLDQHPLPALAAAGVRCSISTDDPAMFDTDLTRDYEAATAFGLDPRDFYEAGLAGALCDEATKKRLADVSHSFEWRRFEPGQATLVQMTSQDADGQG